MYFQIVLAAIDLDYYAMLQANEIDDVSFSWRLPSEMKSARSPRAEVIPDFYFLWCQRLT